MSSLTVQVRWWCCVVVVVVSYNEQRTDNEREGCFSRKGFPIFLEIQFLDFICWISGGILFLECQKYHCAQNRAVIFLEKIHIYIFFQCVFGPSFSTTTTTTPKHTSPFITYSFIAQQHLYQASKLSNSKGQE